MAFITGSITNANPGPTLYALIETAALGIGWTLDDTVVIGGNTHKVLKSAAAGNTYGLDWFLDIYFPTTGITGGMRFNPFEGYTAASDVGLRGPYNGSNTTVDATTYSRFGATTSALETNWTSVVVATLSASAFTYWVSITRDRIIVMTSLEPANMIYTGFFTPTAAHTSHAGAALFPLITADVILSTSNSTIAVTRAPKVSTGTVNWNAMTSLSTSSDLSWAMSGQVGVAAGEFTGVTQIMPVAVSFGTSGNTGHVGYLDGLAMGRLVNTAVRGDTVTVGSDTWYCTTPSTYGLFMKGV